MAQIEDGIRAKLLTVSAVTAIVLDPTQIRSDVMFHRDHLPCILINVQTEQRDTDLSGYGGLTHATVAINCLSRVKQEARSLADAVKGTSGSGLEAFDGTAGGFAFHVESIPERNHSHQDIGDSSTDVVYEVELVCKVGYSETV